MYVSVLCVIHGIRIELHCAVLALQQVYILHLTGHWYAVHSVQCRSVQLIYLQHGLLQVKYNFLRDSERTIFYKTKVSFY